MKFATNRVRTSLCVGVMLGMLCLLPTTQADESLESRLSNLSGEHPRLFVNEKDWPALEARVKGDPLLLKTYGYIQAHAEGLLEVEVLKREKTGKRLLKISRLCLKRVTYLSMAYLMTGDKRYLRRAEAEMLAVAKFKDWNPSHFLDVAEMTAALAVGYDWLYDDLSPESRKAIRKGIVEKGLKPSLKGGWWVSGENNWNQVCHGGLTLGALAVAEDEPKLAHTIIERAITNLPIAMHEYEPDGVYPEGPTYWKYGTSFNVVMIAALESALGSDFGLMDAEGFKKSPYFYLHEVGSVGQFFNFADNGLNGGVSASMHWFAHKLNDPGLLWNEQKTLEALVSGPVDPKSGGNRILALMLTWAQPISTVDAPKELFWTGNGASPVFLSRSSWDKEATFIGIKGGSPSTNHGHMDVGSFVLDMLGERWAVDLGPQSYHSLESQGIDLWNRKQDSERWTVFRLNNFSHSTLSVNGQLQQIKGHAPIEHVDGESEYPSAEIDMTAVYDDQLKFAWRGVMHGKDLVRIQDVVKGLEQDTTVRWAMTTRASVTIIDATTAKLEQGGKTILLSVLSPNNVQLAVESIDEPKNDYDAVNPNTRRVIFDVPVPTSTVVRIRVLIGKLDENPMKRLPFPSDKMGCRF